MSYLAVIDTNVLVSALLKSDSNPAKIVEHALIGEITPVLNDEILEEYIDVLHRPKFSFDERDITKIILGIKDRGYFIEPDFMGYTSKKERKYVRVI